MIESISLKFSENADLVLPVTGITIFVGPNNSGKSLVLKEIEQALGAQERLLDLHILRDFSLRKFEFSEFADTVSRFEKLRDPGIPSDNVPMAKINPNSGLEKIYVHLPSAKAHYPLSENSKYWWANSFVRWGMIRLDGRSRFNLTNDQNAGDILEPPTNVLSHLFQDDIARNKVRLLINDAFGLNFIIDPTKLGTLRIRLSREPLPNDEQSLSFSAREYYKRATYIKDSSDGVQAYTGIITAVLSGEFHTILIDEPEAFLHPPLARKLGKQIGNIAAERKGALLASTHSAEFLMGCVQATRDVKVVRLEYNNGKSRGRMVDPQDLEKFFKRPLMRSANVVAGLFYDGVVVTESENDRAFYYEIYHRLTQINSAYPSVLFIHAQNKQTIRDIIGPLRRFGVPAVAVPDIDILKDGGQDWSAWLSAAHVPEPLHQGYANQRSAINKIFSDNNLNMHNGGVELLTGIDKQAANVLFDTLAEYGIFAVRSGEVERWLLHLAVPGKKTQWTVNMLERLGSDSTAPDYVMPTSGDVWDFMREVLKWIGNPARKGIA